MGFLSPHLRDISVAVSDVRRTDAPDRFHYRGRTEIGSVQDHIGVDSRASHVNTRTRVTAVGACDARIGDGDQRSGLGASGSRQPAPDLDVNQRVNW